MLIVHSHNRWYGQNLSCNILQLANISGGFPSTRAHVALLKAVCTGESRDPIYGEEIGVTIRSRAYTFIPTSCIISTHNRYCLGVTIISAVMRWRRKHARVHLHERYRIVIYTSWCRCTILRSLARKIDRDLRLLTLLCISRTYDFTCSCVKKKTYVRGNVFTCVQVIRKKFIYL